MANTKQAAIDNAKRLLELTERKAELLKKLIKGLEQHGRKEARAVNKPIYDEKRRQYMAHEITHRAFYLWCGEFIGVTPALLPVSLERVKLSNDPHLNDIPLKLWDDKDAEVRALAYDKGLSWSLSDTVSALKNLALELVGK